MTLKIHNVVELKEQMASNQKNRGPHETKRTFS